MSDSPDQKVIDRLCKAAQMEHVLRKLWASIKPVEGQAPTGWCEIDYNLYREIEEVLK